MRRKEYLRNLVSRCSLIAALSLCLLLAPPALAQDQTIAQMIHTSWTGKDGAPQAINALAQTPDGLLWIGSAGGLFSFDGLRFAAFSPKSGSSLLSASTIRSLMVSKQGDLWVFFFHGAPACIHNGTVRFYDHAENEAITVLDHPQQDSDGSMFAVLNWRHLVRLGSDSIWHKVPNPIAGAGDISGVFIDSGNTLWVIENNLLYRKSRRDSAFTATDIHVYGSAKFAENKDHSLWVISQSAGPGPAAPALQYINSAGHRMLAPRVDGQHSDIIVASDGSVWVQTDFGLRRLRTKEIAPSPSGRSVDAPDVFRLRTGISDIHVQALLQDADGNIWVGGMGGLDRFKHANLVPVVAPSKIGEWFTCADAQGEVWVGTAEGKLFTVMKGGKATPILKGGGGSNLTCGSNGRAYFLQDSGISLVSRDHVQHLPLLPGLTQYGVHYLFLGLVEDPDGALVAAVGGRTGQGLWRYADGRWSRFLDRLALPEVCAMLEDSRNDLYLAFTPPDNRIGVVRKGSWETQPVSIGTIGFARTSYGIVAYGMKGIAIERNKNFQVLSFIQPEHAKVVTGVVEARGGELWLMGVSGVVRIPAVEVRAAVADPSHAISSVNFQEGDFVGPDTTLLFRHSADIDTTGRLWFSTLNGVVSVEPDHLAAPRRPPLLSIRSITADGNPLNANRTLSPDTQYLEIQYFGLDLTSPKNVVYRYHLDGLDTTWQDVGPRTDAIYTHLRPGKYRFQVMASNGNDLWTAPVSSPQFTILPRFYQRTWFVILSSITIVLMLWLAYCTRFRSVSREVSMRAEERADERIRIARELHDTLLQGVQGLLLSFHVAAQKAPANHESRQGLEKALATAERIILEGRNRVSRLRSEYLTDTELIPSIEAFAAEVNGNPAITFSVDRKGENDSLQAPVVEEIFCIAREALTNAFRHSQASRIVVSLDYQRRRFILSCRDNGRGFDWTVLQATGTNGHWGLRGMVERAEKIGAKFSCASSPGKGTDLQVTVPARRAYVRRTAFWPLSTRRSSS